MTIFTFLFFLACGEKTTDTAESSTSSEPSNTDTIEPADTAESTDTSVQFVTIGVYTKDEQGNYVDTGKTLFFEVGVPCYSWTRSAPPHDNTGGLEAQDEPHDHYNAGDNTSYIDGIFTWTEYGPEHTQEDIDATCAAGVDGVVKSVNADEYYEDHGGLYLRITEVE